MSRGRRPRGPRHPHRGPHPFAHHPHHGPHPFAHHPHHGPHPFARLSPSHPLVRKYLQFSLQRRLFFWFGATIVVSALVVRAMFHFSHGVLPLFVGLAVVWGAAGFIARRLSRPIHRLALVADEIGHGQLASRRLIPRHHRYGEVRVLADALYDMATRIEKQLADQRALLATVSHELRTPLARIRLLVELAHGAAGEGSAAASSLDEIDREIIEIDALVGDLLANSRLDFAAVQPAVLDAAEIAQQAVERTGVDPSKLVVETDGGEGRLAFRGDPTLATRALVNLLENAERHAGGVARFRVHGDGDFVAFDVEDDGPGFLPGEEVRVFEPFYKNPRNPSDARSTGLGLALVQRIASAHGGDVRAENRAPAEGRTGARVGIRFSRAEA